MVKLCEAIREKSSKKIQGQPALMETRAHFSNCKDVENPQYL